MRKLRKVCRNQRYVEYGPGHKPFGIKSVYGNKAKTTRGTEISLSRLAVARYYKAL